MTNANQNIEAAIAYLERGGNDVTKTINGLTRFVDGASLDVIFATDAELSEFGAALEEVEEGEDKVYDENCVYSEFCFGGVHDSRIIPGMIGSLKMLRYALRKMHAAGVSTEEVWGVCVTDLPTFGGEAPEDTSEVWSWDNTHLLVGETFSDLELVEREDA